MVSLDFIKSKEILSKYNILSCKEKLVGSKEEAFIFAEKIGFPVVLYYFDNVTARSVF